MTPATDLAPVLASVRALPALPVDEPGDRYGFQAVTAAWLGQYSSKNTQVGYFGDLSRYLTWCQGEGLSPLIARPADVVRYQNTLTMSPTSQHRRLSALSSWYTFLQRNDKVHSNPVAGLKRPKVDWDESTTVGLTVDEVRHMMRTADQAVKAAGTDAERYIALRNRLVLRLLADLGMRRAEVVGLDLSSLGYNRGHRTVRFLGKGLETFERPLTAHILEALDTFLAMRGDEPGPLIATRKRGGGHGRVHVKNIWRLVRTVAVAAGIPGADRISPHSFRHAFATNALDLGLPLTDVQDALGHKDPRTTRRYDRGRRKLHRDPALRLGEQYMDRDDDDEGDE